MIETQPGLLFFTSTNNIVFYLNVYSNGDRTYASRFASWYDNWFSFEKNTTTETPRIGDETYL